MSHWILWFFGSLKKAPMCEVDFLYIPSSSHRVKHISASGICIDMWHIIFADHGKMYCLHAPSFPIVLPLVSLGDERLTIP